jgi:threonine synthase
VVYCLNKQAAASAESLMPTPTALACVRCGTRVAIAQFAGDCPACRRSDAPANLTVVYDEQPGARCDRRCLSGAPASQWKWEDFLPAAAKDAVTLGEGNTPLLPAPALGLGKLWIKDETRNPTWSFKDRFASVAVTCARQRGAQIIAASSSGNAGAAAAAYAAKAGIGAVVFTEEHASAPLVAQMRAYGAMVVLVKTAAERWRLLAAGVRALGWYPTSPFFAPAVGSNPLGVEGYKTIAFEIAAALDWRVPDWCVLPVCYGDALYGMWKGFEELRALQWIARTPRFVAAEASGSLGAALERGAAMPPVRQRNTPTLATSIGASQGTVQALEVLSRTDGVAVTVSNEELMHWLQRLARSEGMWAEAAAVAPLAAIERLRASGVIDQGACVVALLTASGLKDHGVSSAAMPSPPLVTGGLDDLLRALKISYGWAHA